MTRHLILAALFAATLVAPAFAAPVAAGGVAIVVPARDIARGETIQPSDLTSRNVPASDVLSETVTDPARLAGMQARRVLAAGQSVRSDDVRAPILVTKGQTVTMTFSAPGIVLTSLGRAMGEGGLGETVVVQNPVSFRMINATVTGAGAVSATGLTTALAAK